MEESVLKEIGKQLAEVVKKRDTTLNETSLANLDLNPFLLRALGLETPEEIADFVLTQRVERSIVTSFGQRIQKIAKMLAERGTGVEGADICKEKDGRRYYIQIKAGPQTVNKDITNEINRLLGSATRRNQGSIALIGMTYGTRNRVSDILQKYSQVDWLIGREFWEFISDDEECAKKIFDAAAEVARQPGGGVSYRKHFEEKVRELASQIRERYGTDESGRVRWDRLFDDNM